jgi:hypothetical protein
LALALPDRRYARIGGALYLVIIVVGIVGPLLTRERLVVADDVAATAQNIAASPDLWRLGIALNLVMQICDVPVMLILFLLLSPVGRPVALGALIFNIIQTATLAANQLTLVAADLYSPAHPAFADVAIQAYASGEALGLAFFGVTLLGTGYLIRHSGYLPWILGLMVQIAGASYLITSFAQLVFPDTPTIVFVVFLVPAFVAEFSLALRLLLKGVDASGWERFVHRAQAAS